MIVLDNSIKLEAVLAGAVSANQPEFHVNFSSWNVEGVKTRPEPARGALNNSTDVTLLAAATTQNERREVESVVIYNKDTASVTLTVKTDDGTNERIICKVTLATTESLFLDENLRPTVLQANGAVKTGSGVTGPASSTDNAVARWDGTGGTILQNSAFVVDDSGQVTSFGGNIAFPASQASSAGANVFDDYEEGTWTPAVTFATPGDLSVTYTQQAGTYRKLGAEAHINHTIITATFTHTTASGNMHLTGAPFTSLTATNMEADGALSWAGITKAGYTNIVTAMTSNTTIMLPIASGSGVGRSIVTTADAPTGGTVVLIGTNSYPTPT